MCAGASLLASIIGISLLEETYAPIIRIRRAKRNGDPEFATKFSAPVVHTSKLQYLWITLSRPIVLLTRSIVCFMLSFYMAL